MTVKCGKIFLNIKIYFVKLNCHVARSFLENLFFFSSFTQHLAPQLHDGLMGNKKMDNAVDCLPWALPLLKVGHARSAADSLGL